MTHKLKRPNFSEGAVMKLVEAEYGYSGKLQKLPSYIDQNFLLITENGEKYVVKIANEFEKKETLEFQNAAMKHLANKNNSEMSPQVIKSKDDLLIVTLKKEDTIHFVRLVTFLSGKALAQIKPHHHTLLRKFGKFLGHLGNNLADFDHPAANYDFHWDLKIAHTVIKKNMEIIDNQRKIEVLEFFLEEFIEKTLPKLNSLRTSIIHGDANDYNVLVNYKETPFDYDFGIIDFGDLIKSYTIFELAIAIAYVTLYNDDPIDAAVSVIEGYNSIFPLMEGEIELLYNLICMRLCQSVSFSAYQQTLEPENEYLKISENKAWESLFKLRGINPNYAHYAFRNACNLDPHPYVNELVELLETNQNLIYPILKDEISTKSHMVFDLSIGSLEIDTFEGLIDEKQVIAHIYRSLKEAKKEIGIGRYNEARIYKIKTQTNTFDNPTIHLGIDLFLKPKTPIYAPFEGTLTSIKQDISPTNTIYAIILEHLIGDKKLNFFTLYKNLDGETAKELQLGKKINKGELLGYVGKIENFEIPLSYVHFQISVDLLDDVDSFPSSINAHKKKLWLSLCPDPNVLLKIPQKSFL